MLNIKINQDPLKTEESEVQELHQEKGIFDTARHISYMHSSKQQEENAMLYVSGKDALRDKSFDTLSRKKEQIRHIKFKDIHLS